jgi:ketosteroid isomerase-like protein
MSNQEFDTVVGKFIEAVESGDEAALQQIYSNDVGVWHNFNNITISKDANIALLMDLCRKGVRVRHVLEEQLLAGNRGVRRHRIEATTAGGQRVVLRAAMFVSVEGGQITRIDEYIDSKELDALGAAIAADLNVAAIDS